MRKHLRVVTPFVLVILVACILAAWRTWGPDKEFNSRWPELQGGFYSESVSYNGQEYVVPPNEIYASGVGTEGRPALYDPQYVDVTTADTKIADDLEGIAITVGNQQRFYPFQILNWHEIVNTEVGGESLVITYSPLSGSAVVYKDDRDFYDAGKVYNNTMLMTTKDDDRLWSQTTGDVIVGERAGQTLTIYPSEVLTWAAWKDLHPDGLALSTDTGYARDYSRHPYASYETSPGIFFPLNHVLSDMQPKDIVYRVDGLPGQAPVTYLARYVPIQTDTNETLGSEGQTRDVVAFYNEALDTVRVFDRAVAGQGSLTFTQAGGEITDTQTGSTWSADGVALTGALRGTALQAIPVTRHYAFAYFALYPQAVISGEELLTPDESQAVEGEDLLIN